MRCLLLCSTIALAACASGATNTSGSTQATARVSGGGSGTTNVRMDATNVASVSRVAYPIDRVWRLMPSVYDSLGITLTTLDGTKHFVGNEGMKVRQKLKGVALSTYIDCGSAQIGPSADSYDVFLAVTTVLRAVTPMETEIATTVESAAKPITFAQDYSRCATKGKIETAISAIVAARLTAAK